MTMLAVDVEELCVALEGDAPDARWFFDCETGDVLLINSEYEPAENRGLTEAEIESNPIRFKPVPPAQHEALTDMRAFVNEIKDATLRDSLALALSAPKPDRRFRAVLGWLPAELEHWRTFRHQQMEKRAHQWLQSLGIEAKAREER